MKLTIKQDNLAKALSSTGRVATARAGLPILANVLLRTEGNKLLIAATNLEVAVTTAVGAQVEKQGAIAAPARLLTEFVSSLPHVNVDLEVTETKLKINAAGYKSTINAILPDDYPALPDPATEKTIAIPTDDLKRSIRGTVLVTSNDTTRPILTGVNFYTLDGNAYMAATDGYRLAEAKVAEVDGDLSAIIPSSTLSDVARQLGGDKNDITIRYNDEQITFEIGETSITSRLIDGRFIDYRQLIPGETNFIIKTDRSELIKTVKIAGLFARETAGSIIIEGNAADGTLNVRSITSQLGDNTSAIDAEITANGNEPCTVSLNSKFLLDALNCLSSEQVTMKFNGKLSPVLLTGDNDEGYKHIIMPVKS